MQALKIIFILTAIVILVLHILAAILSKKAKTVLSYVNMCLHIAMFFELMAQRASIELLALSFMVSLLVSLSVSLLCGKIKERRGGGDL